jgi:hypothetical protein
MNIVKLLGRIVVTPITVAAEGSYADKIYKALSLRDKKEE